VVKWKGRDVDLSAPFNAKVKNEGSHASAPSICLNGVERTTSPFFYLLLLNVYGGSDYSTSNDKMGGE
jgi:hypothetical protein